MNYWEHTDRPFAGAQAIGCCWMDSIQDDNFEAFFDFFSWDVSWDALLDLFLHARLASVSCRRTWLRTCRLPLQVQEEGGRH